MKKKPLQKIPETDPSDPATPPHPNKGLTHPVKHPPVTDEEGPSTQRKHGPIGVITHYYSHLGVAVVQLVGDTLEIGDIVQIKGHTTDLIQRVDSMELDHQQVDRAAMGDLLGIKVLDHVREHDHVFKIPKE